MGTSVKVCPAHEGISSDDLDDDCLSARRPVEIAGQLFPQDKFSA